jgi:hypothetical protein
MLAQSSANASAERVALFSILSSLHQWEVEQAELLRSTTGRHLYFSIGQRALVSGMSPTVKEVITANHITDRALRLRLVELIDKGYLSHGAGQSDARTRSLHPSVAFEGLVSDHLEAFRKLVNTQFMLIGKENLSALDPLASSTTVNGYGGRRP